jgi:hypothetical protein
MLYFLDPTFKMRSEIPPPTTFVSLQGGGIVPQSPIDQRQHLISPPEAPPRDMSHAEQAFLDGLDDREEIEESEVFDDWEESHAAAEEPH